jgi:hypothetical protein
VRLRPSRASVPVSGPDVYFKQGLSAAWRQRIKEAKRKVLAEEQ